MSMIVITSVIRIMTVNVVAIKTMPRMIVVMIVFVI